MVDTGGSAPSTPARNPTSSSSSSPPPRSTPATSTEKPKPSSSSNKTCPSSEDDDEEMKVVEPSSELEIMELDDDDEKEEKEKETKTKKRKAPSTTSTKPVATASKKSKTSSSSSKPSTSKLSTTTTDSTPSGTIDVSNDLVSFKSGKLQHKQKNGPKHDVVASYMIGRAAFIEWAVEFFKTEGTSSNEKLPEIPTQHFGAIAKDVQEAPQLLTGLAKSIRNNLASSITENMSALEDSQDDAAEEKVEPDTTEGGGVGGRDEKEKKDKILERIDLDSIKKTIETLSVRKNYGLALEDLKNEKLPSGISSIPTSLQFWVWEVQDFKLLSSELVARFEKRRTEREEIKRSVTELFQSLSEQEQTNLLLNGKKGGGGATTESTSTTTNKKKKDVKGKGKAKQDDQDEQEGGEEEEKKPAKGGGGKKKKELTEQEKLEKEEKDRKKAEEKAQKEAAKVEKAAKDAVEKEKKEKKRKEKEEKKRLEEEKKALEQAKMKKQQGFFNSFKQKGASPTPSSTSASASIPSNSIAGPSSNRASPGISRSASPGQQPPIGDFAKVFHTFTVRPGVKLAPINRFNKNEKKSSSISVEIDSDPSLTLKESLSSFVKGVPKRRIPVYNPYPKPLYSVRELVVGINDSTLTSQDTTGFYEILKDREKVPVKLFKFKEDVRPGYVGTWSKISKVVTPRTPFGRDGAVLNYEHDSEAEWEEEPDDEDADNVDKSDAEMSNDDDDDGECPSEVDSWLADDDEIQYESGYEEDGDIVMMDADQQRNKKLHRDRIDDSDADEDDDVIVVESEKDKKERLRKEKEKKKKLEERQKKRKQQGPLLPLVKGPVWEDVEGGNGSLKEPAFKSMKIRFLNDCSYGINPLTFVSVPPQAPQPVVAPLATVVDSKDQTGKENIAVGSSSTSSPAALSSSTDKDSNNNNKKKKPVGSTTGTTGSTSSSSSSSSSSKKPFPENLLKTFLSSIQGSDKTQPVIVDEFVRKNKGTNSGLTKTACLSKWKEIGIKKSKGKMVVPEALLAQHGLRG